MTSAPKYQALLDNLPDTVLCATTSTVLLSGFAAAIRVYPNPADASVRVEIEGISIPELHICLTDNLGRPAMVKEVTAADAAAGFTLDIAALPAGWYFIRTTDNRIAPARLLVIR